jgi:hypothetical protein
MGLRGCVQIIANLLKNKGSGGEGGIETPVGEWEVRGR